MTRTDNAFVDRYRSMLVDVASHVAEFDADRPIASHWPFVGTPPSRPGERHASLTEVVERIDPRHLDEIRHG